MQKALLLVNSYFPTGAAMSSRMLNFGRLLYDAGWSVHVIAGHHVNPEIVVGKIYKIDGITYQVASARKKTAWDTYFGENSFRKALTRYLKNNAVDCIFTIAACETYGTVKALCHKYGCRLYVEQCEWMDLSNYRLGKLDIRFIMVDKLRRNGFKGANGVVSISRLLNDYYAAMGTRTIRIPTILDVGNTEFTKEIKNKDDRIHLTFAGSLGGTKELMRPILEALTRNDKYRRSIVFDIYGPSEEAILNNIGGDTELLKLAQRSIVIHGRIPQEKVTEVFSHSNYLIFVRPERRSSNAGFPTKLAESMAVGTPVITNKTGDIDIYLRNEDNGFLLPNNTAEAICECFERLMDMSKTKYSHMREAARKTAEDNFDYHVYMDELSTFFSE